MDGQALCYPASPQLALLHEWQRDGVNHADPHHLAVAVYWHVVPVAAAGWAVWWSTLGEEHLVDEVDGGVGGLDVAPDHAGVAVDGEVLAAADDLEGVALRVLWLPTSWSGASWPWTTW
jgi:hypothetical protein